MNCGRNLQTFELFVTAMCGAIAVSRVELDACRTFAPFM